MVNLERIRSAPPSMRLDRIQRGDTNLLSVNQIVPVHNGWILDLLHGYDIVHGSVNDNVTDSYLVRSYDRLVQEPSPLRIDSVKLHAYEPTELHAIWESDGDRSSFLQATQEFIQGSVDADVDIDSRVYLRLGIGKHGNMYAEEYSGEHPITEEDIARSTNVGNLGIDHALDFVNIGTPEVIFSWSPVNTGVVIRTGNYPDTFVMEQLLEEFYKKTDPEVPVEVFSRALAHAAYDDNQYYDPRKNGY